MLGVLNTRERWKEEVAEEDIFFRKANKQFQLKRGSCDLADLQLTMRVSCPTIHKAQQFYLPEVPLDEKFEFDSKNNDTKSNYGNNSGNNNDNNNNEQKYNYNNDNNNDDKNNSNSKNKKTFLMSL